MGALKSAFPLLDAAVMNGEAVIAPDAKLFKVDELTAAYASSMEGVKRGVGSYGPLRLPFDDCWFEFGGEAGSVVRLRNKPIGMTERDAPELAGALESATHWISSEVFLPGYTGPLLRDQGMLFLTDEQGSYLKCTGYTGWTPDKYQGELGAGVAEGFRDIIAMDSMRALFMVGLANCRNVSTQVQMTLAGGGKRSRRVRPSVEYRVVSLPAELRTSLAGAGRQSSDSRFHTVRGHFKTFTDDAPLLGKLTGTYWWGWQARGSKDNGEIVSSYDFNGAVA